ncbi:MAG: hypothetical protein AVDCRST_MAG40-1611, partial [uncultured Gemmatimonadaceae bacterium]
ARAARADAPNVATRRVRLVPLETPAPAPRAGGPLPAPPATKSRGATV